MQNEPKEMTNVNDMEILIERPKCSAGTVLLIEDSEDLCLVISVLLQSANYRAVTAVTGIDGIQKASDELPHLILLDVGLPDISGYEVCKALKQSLVTHDIPIIFISGKMTIEEQVKGLQSGALDYIPKPINKEILLSKTHSFVQLSREHRKILMLQDQQIETRTELLQLSQALDNANDGVLMTDAHGKVSYANISFGYMSQRPLDEIENQGIESIFTDEQRLRKMLSGAKEGISVSIESALVRKEEGNLPVLLRCTAIMNEVFQPIGMMFLITDLSEQKRADEERERLEVELFHSQKLESVGQLAAGIAHEINTPIQFVGDNIRFMRDAIQDLFELHEKQQTLLEAAKRAGLDEEIIQQVEKAAELADLEFLTEELPKAIEQSLDGVSRVASIVRAMKEFAHPGTSEMNPADLNEAITTTITVARNKWKYDAEMELDLDPTLPHVPCLIGELNQVILNLIVNAADAIHDHRGDNGAQGFIKISTRHINSWAEIRVEDSGGGIPLAIQDKVFNPFFTTKEVGRGSGQGLAIARGVILNKHKGEFFFETEPGVGTTFIIRIPIAPPTPFGRL
jgi:two-component system, NtrC family, sensor kinase